MCERWHCRAALEGDTVLLSVGLRTKAYRCHGRLSEAVLLTYMTDAITGGRRRHSAVVATREHPAVAERSPTTPAETGVAVDGPGHLAAGSGQHVAADLGEVTLAPALTADFRSGGVPEDWYVEAWTEGGEAGPGEGCLVVRGARVGYGRLEGAGRSLEFEAAFGSEPHQYAGFGTDYESVPWVTVSTKYGHAVYARTNFYESEDIRMAASLRGSFHRYRVEWNVLDVRFFVDDAERAYLLVPVPAYMRPLLAAERRGEDPLRVRWLRASPYAREGSFTSRVHDGGGEVAWTAAGWDATLPPGTSGRLELRAGPVAEPDGSWGPWSPVGELGPGSGADLEAPALRGRYAQYRLRLATARPERTPSVREVRLRYVGITGRGSSREGGTSGA